MIGLGHNMPPPIVAFDRALDDVYVEAKNWLDGAVCENQAQADAIGIILSTARRIRRDADTARADEKRPHDDAAKAVQEKWRPLLQRADNIVATAQKPLAAFLEAEAERQREEATRARAEALRLQQEAARATREAEGNLTALEDAQALQKAADAATKGAAKAEKAKPQAAGDGRAVGLRSHQVAEVTDRRALLEYVLRHDPDPLAEWLAEYARKALPRQLPGVTIKTERKAA